ncbi:uncharacterized protein LOC127801677 isoform X2 [Diospyros lotus]|uniref:uncharacterized protein LOC127801677 isoform X2 n=1 Tax=Diospyros lotus TaxID=55363 RepID=UPI002259C171|nr:uncharacterized protein LOC127801677 isoform X2 [Diospyros lotus]
MAKDAGSAAHARKKEEKRPRSIFDLPPDFFDSCLLLQSPISSVEPSSQVSEIETLGEEADKHQQPSQSGATTKTSSISRWSCNTCKAEFESLDDQRSHFKSDFHRFNVKLSIAGKDIVKEDDFDELTSGSLFTDWDISSISGSEDEAEKGSFPPNGMDGGLSRSVKQKLYICLQKGERISIWRCLLLDEADNIMFKNDKLVPAENGNFIPFLKEKEVIEKLKFLIHEPRDNTCLRVVLLASGGHFAGCVFDGNSIVAHKTFHRYVIRAKAGKKQSSKDASGKAAHSAGASLRRYNELALKKEIQELLATWKPYFDASSCVFIYAPSNNRQLLFDGEKPYFSCKRCAIRNIPLTVRRPTFKEARRVYNWLTQVCEEVDEEKTTITKESSLLSANDTSDDCLESTSENLGDKLESRDTTEAYSGVKKSDTPISKERESEILGTTTLLHEAAKSGNDQKVLELLEQGLDPCIKDERGQTPFMLATDKEVRNTFRRFMASNLDKWDWHAARVPSALTKEMELSQAAKQAEKDAKRKARSKELKKLRKAREKKAEAEAALSQSAPIVPQNRGATSIAISKGQSQSTTGSLISKEEELKRAQAAEREKRAAAAERRMAAAAAKGSDANIAPAAVAAASSSSSSSQPRGVVSSDDVKCSCCNTSLVGKVPFHRYNYKYCSTSCMHVHREMLEDE